MMMTNDFQNGAAKTKEVLSDATEAVAGRAREGTTRMNKFLHATMDALPMASVRLFEAMLARVGLERRSSGLGGVAMFIGGFAAGSVTTAFATPVSGPELRKRVRALASDLLKDAKPIINRAKPIIDQAKPIIDQAKPIIEHAKPIVAEVAKEVSDLRAAAHHNGHQKAHNGKKSHSANGR